MKILLILYTLCSAFASPAEEIQENLDSRKTFFQDKAPVEKVHVQLSEEVIATGETLWFQASLSALASASQTDNPPDSDSKVLYLEVMNSQQAVLQGIYSIKNGITKGQIHIPDTLSGGWYQVRAYTQWMRNQGEIFYWSQPLMIINPYEDKVSVQKPQQTYSNDETAFFPEGGSYVEGLPNRILVHLSEDLMLDTITSAQVISLEDSIPITEVKLESGQGIFTLTPEPDQDYILEMYLSRGDTLQEPLPIPQEQGATLQAKFGPNGLQVDVYHSHEGSYTLMLRKKDELLYTEQYNDDTFSKSLASQSWAAGIIELLVVDEQQNVLAERLLYNTSVKEGVQIALDKATYLPREELSVNISLAPTISSSEVAVTVRKVNPLTDYLEYHRHTLSLIDKVSMPETFNDAENVSRINKLLIAKKSPYSPLSHEMDEQDKRFNREDESLTVSGKVEELTGKNAAGRVVVLSVPGRNPYFEYDFVNSDGSFQIPIKENVVGKKDIVLQMADTSLQVQWTLDEKFIQENTFKNETFPLVPESVLKEILQSYTGRSQIYSQYGLFHAQDSSGLQTKSDFRFYGAPNFEVRLENYIELPNFVEVNRELMPGIRLRESKGTYNLDVFDIPSRTFLPGEPSVFLDGVLIHDLNYLVNFPPAEIEMIETVNRRTYYGEYRFDGTIAIYTLEGDAFLPAISPSAKQAEVTLYTPSLVFSRTASLQAHEPDFRTLLHWQPSVKLSNEPYTLTLSNADELGEFEIIVEGFTEDRRRIYGRKTYRVALTDLP